MGLLRLRLPHPQNPRSLQAVDFAQGAWELRTKISAAVLARRSVAAVRVVRQDGGRAPKDNRRRFLRKALAIADGRLLVFKLHPNENVARNTAEIRSIAPGALVYSEGNAHHMVANADVLVTQYSTLAYTGILLGKEVHSYFDVETLKRLAPLQNGGTSGREIAAVCRGLLEERWERRAS